MKRLILLCFILLFLPLVQAAPQFFSTPGSDRIIAFVSQYSSANSLDFNTFEYWEKVRDSYSVYMVQDTWVVANNSDWRTAIENSDMVFVISLSDTMLSTDRSAFCDNLGAISKPTGVFFVGKSVYSRGTTYGCIYEYGYATTSRNDNIQNNSITITAQHEITSGYELKTYKLGIRDSIYTVNSPTQGTVLAKAYGDPDAGGTLKKNYYPALTVWEGLMFRAVAWSLNTSDLSGCTDCLEWDLLTNALNWASNTSAIGLKITTDKDSYAQGDLINVNVVSPIDISRPSGEIKRPDGRKDSITFSGSGKTWSSTYRLLDEDPNGDYKITVSSGNSITSKVVSVRAFYIVVNAYNQTKQTRITVNVVNSTAIDDIDITLSLTTPSGKREVFSYPNVVPYPGVEDVTLIYNITEYGKYSLNTSAVDSRGRSTWTSTPFYFFQKILTLKPNSITRNVTQSTTLIESVILNNSESSALTNIKAIKNGIIKDWLTFSIDTIPQLQPNELYTFKFNISVPTVSDGLYKGNITFSYDQGEVYLPINITMKSIKTLTFDKTKIERFVNGSVNLTEELSISNNLDIELTNIKVEKSGNISNWITLERTSLPDLDPDDSTALSFDIKVPDVAEGNYTGSIKFTFTQGSNEIPIVIVMKLLGILKVEPTSAIVWTNPTTTKTVEFSLSNEGRGSIIMKSVEVKGDLKNYARVISQSTKIEPNKTGILKIELNPKNVVLTDVSKLIVSDVDITTDAGVKTVSIAFGIIKDPSPKTQELSSDIGEVEEELLLAKKIETEDLTQEIQSIREDLASVQSLYNLGSYAEAADSIADAERRLNDVKSEIENRKTEAELKAQIARENFIKTAVVAFALMIVGVAAWFVYNKYWKRRGYAWLYKKWGARYYFLNHSPNLA